MPIPPAGWGAVEQLIWDYAVLLREKGHHVDIINEPDRTVIVAAVNTGSYDIAHIHYDVFQDIIPRLLAKKVCVTSAYPYVDKPHLWDAGYREAFYGICKGVKEHGAYCFAMSIKDRNTFLTVGGLREDQVILMPNGVKTDSFRITDTPTLATRSVVLAKIEPRKRQHLTYWLPQVDYIGRGPFSHKNYRGELEPRERLLQLLTEFGNFVLLSDGENGTPLVVKEAMAAGLGVVLSESAANELPALPWVTVVPEADLGNTRKLHEAIEANRAASAGFRHTIREWVQKEWDWSKLVDQYVSNLKACLEK
jgi:glycosyltransferase involved in cell wall biosynthesis